MFFPLKTDVPMSRLPLANWALMAAITIGSFAGWMRPPVYDTLAGITVIKSDAPQGVKDDALAAVDNLYAAVGAGRNFTATETREFHPPAWRLPLLAISSVFVEERTMLRGIIVLLGNLLFLLLFGNAVNYKFGHLPYLALFFGAALISGLAFYLTTSDIPLSGASGAIMGITGAFLVYFPRNDITLAHVMSPWYGTFEVPSWAVILVWFVYDMMSFAAGGQIGLAYVSHLVGFLLGFGTAWLLAYGKIIRPAGHEETLLDLADLAQAKLRS
jgi:membrane associated rhomboid family serine protease